MNERKLIPRSLPWASSLLLLAGGALSCVTYGDAQPALSHVASNPPAASESPTSTSRPIYINQEQSPIDPDAPPAIEDPTGVALDSFFEGLHLAESGHPGGRVLISQFGDSHTAADMGTSRLRRQMQSRFGDAGRGIVWAGRPVRYYDQRDGSFAQEGKWQTENGLRRTAQEPFGVMGFRNTFVLPDPKAPKPPPPKKKMTKAEKAKEAALLAQKPKLTVGTCESCPLKNVSRFEIFYRRFEDGGKMKLYLDGAPEEAPIIEVDTKSNPNQPSSGTAYYTISMDDGPHKLSIMPAGDGNVELFGVVMERDQPGVVVDALGVGGVEASALVRWDWTYISEQLKRRDPRLVILAYGTNESANTGLKIEKVEQNFVTIIQRLKAAVPEASILVMGPPDRTIRERKDCDKGKKAPSKSKKPPSKKPQATAANAPLIPEGCEWRTPLIIPEIVEAQRRAAMKEGVAFFDTYLAMGGSGSMDYWYKQTPSLASKDHTHLSKAGYEKVSDMLYEALMTSYDEYLARQAQVTPQPLFLP